MAQCKLATAVRETCWERDGT